MTTKQKITGALVGSFAGLLLILLKLWGKIDLGWMWVLMPFWLPKLIMGVVLIVLVVVVFRFILKLRRDRNDAARGMLVGEWEDELKRVPGLSKLTKEERRKVVETFRRTYEGKGEWNASPPPEGVDSVYYRFKLTGAARVTLHKQAPDSGEWLIDVMPIRGRKPAVELNEVFDMKEWLEELERRNRNDK